MFCENCGAENPNDVMFCNNCGNKLMQTQPPVQNHTQPSATAYAQATDYTTHTKPKSNKKMIIIVTILIAVLIAVTAVYFIFFSGSDKNRGENPEDPLVAAANAVNNDDVDVALSTYPEELANAIKEKQWLMLRIEGAMCSEKAAVLRELEIDDIKPDGEITYVITKKYQFIPIEIETNQNEYHSMMREEFGVESDVVFEEGYLIDYDLIYEYSGGTKTIHSGFAEKVFKIDGKWYRIEL